ncbi:MAG: LysR family transcriptional regulator [Peptoniphilus sp.]|nr:LysR family transcriptional regulator [Peptoniphilus sp.]MDD7362681.1 LysR family transcriptional regulator [Bacillota bacterium]MDY6044920.1 LysR family transcriptional regulator [Peptoniphilus sp.]
MNTFLTVTETKNLTEASKRLNITQPAVSGHIRFLEEYYGKKLFYYSGKKMNLTEAGKVLRDASISIRNDEALLKKYLLEPEKSMPPINMGVTMTIGEYVIAKPLARYMKKHPESRIDVEINNTEVLEKKLRDGDIQFALVEGAFDRKFFESLIYREAKFVPVCGKDHSISHKTGRLSDLLDETLLVREEGSGTRSILENQLKLQNLSLGDFKRTIQINGMHTVLQMLEEDLGISFLYYPAAENYLNKGTLKTIELKDFHVYHDFTFIWVRGSAYEYLYREICDELMGNN